MTLKWRGCGDGSYVSHDGLYLIAQVTVPGKKGPARRWALYGRVNLTQPGSERPAPPWGWDPTPLTVGETKGRCQKFAVACGYAAPSRQVEDSVVATEQAEKPTGWDHCQECGVRFERNDVHKYEDYCGNNCAEVAAERLQAILGHGVKLKDSRGRPLRVGPPRPNEPDFRPD